MEVAQVSGKKRDSLEVRNVLELRFLQTKNRARGRRERVNFTSVHFLCLPSPRTFQEIIESSLIIDNPKCNGEETSEITEHIHDGTIGYRRKSGAQYRERKRNTEKRTTG